MTVYLIQHGRATPRDEDPDRPLTDEGRREVARVAAHLSRTGGPAPPRIVHSGKTRARQTAEILGEEAGDGTTVEEAGGLAPMDDPAEWAERLGEEGSVALVGHLPHLSRLAGLLLTGDPDAAPIRFRNGGVVAVERDDEGNGWVLAWALVPELVA